MTIVLLRHGESEGNVLHHIQGWHNYPLTERGHRQAEAAARRLANLPAVALYTSPLARAQETASVVAVATGLAVVELPDLREYCFGEAQGMTWTEAAARWGLSDDDWGVGHVPGEEGMTAFRARVSSQIDMLAASHASDIAICVLHAGTIGALVAHLCGLAPHDHAALYTGNCGIGVIEQAATGRLTIAMLNDQRHLAPEER
jgi:broad specificity phosphatase PhoE